MQQVWFVEKNRKRRKGIAKTCLNCSKEFVTRADKKSPIYCGMKCSQESQRKKEQVVCSQCGVKFYKTPSKMRGSKSGLFFCSKKCKGKAQRIGGIKEIMPPHYGTSTRNYRELYEGDFICRRCGYEEFSCGVEIHHIDGDRKNNSPENFMPLCACCHRALHQKLWENSNGLHSDIFRP